MSLSDSTLGGLAAHAGTQVPTWEKESSHPAVCHAHEHGFILHHYEQIRDAASEKMGLPDKSAAFCTQCGKVIVLLERKIVGEIERVKS